MAISAEFLFTGRLVRAAFATALGKVMERHPMLSAVIEDGPKGPQWVAGPSVEPWLDWNDVTVPIGPSQNEYLDLRQRPGLRVWVRVGDDSSRVLFQIHHCVCDGLAVLQVIGELAALYAAACDPAKSDIRLPPLDAQRLRDRGVVDVGPDFKPTLRTALRDVLATLRVWRRILFQRCAVLAVPQHDTRPKGTDSAASTPNKDPDGRSTKELEHFETHAFCRDETERYKAVAANQNVTLNDLLLRDMLLTVREWNKAHGEEHDGRVRVNVPVYVRGRAGFDIPASNGIGFAFPSVDLSRTADRAAVLREVNKLMRQVKNWKLALYFLGGLAAAMRFGGLVRWALRRKRPMATVVLSYLGPALQQSPLPRRDDGKLICGNVVLEQMAGVPPVRPLTRASVVVLEYGGELTVGMRCDAHLFGPSDTRALLSALVAQIRETIRVQA